MNKKSEQKERKAQLQVAAQRKEQMSRYAIKAAAVVLVPLVLFVLLQGLFTSPPILPPDKIGPGDHVLGAEDANLVVTVYADFQCPQCKAESEMLARVWPRVADRVQLVFRHYPLDIHPHAFTAARYAEAASRQDMFWEMHDLLFTYQPIWSGLKEVDALFDTYVRDLEMDVDQFEEDLKDGAIRNKILADQQGGTKAGVRGTPTMFFNGELVEIPTNGTQFLALVEAALLDLE